MAQAPQLLAAYLAVGPDELKRKEAVSRLKARAAGPFEAFNLEEIEASQRAFAARAMAFDMDYNNNRRLAYNHYFRKS